MCVCLSQVVECLTWPDVRVCLSQVVECLTWPDVRVFESGG
jgi:hypothetical protein